MLQLDDRDVCELWGLLVEFGQYPLYRGTWKDLDSTRYPNRRQIFAIATSPAGDRLLVTGLPRFRKAKCLTPDRTEEFRNLTGWKLHCLRTVVFTEIRS